MSFCSTPRSSWKIWKFLLYTLLSLYEATHVALLRICRIPGCMGWTYATVDSVAYFVLVIKRPRYQCVSLPRLEWTERYLIFSLSCVWCRVLYMGMPRILVRSGLRGKFLGSLPLRWSCWRGEILLRYSTNMWRKVINHSLEIIIY